MGTFEESKVLSLNIQCKKGYLKKRYKLTASENSLLVNNSWLRLCAYELNLLMRTSMVKIALKLLITAGSFVDVLQGKAEPSLRTELELSRLSWFNIHLKLNNR